MRVGVDHARKNEITTGIDGSFGGKSGSDGSRTNGDDARVADDNRTVGHYVLAGIHRHDMSVREDEISGLGRLGKGERPTEKRGGEESEKAVEATHGLDQTIRNGAPSVLAKARNWSVRG
jgi:hypothetical protein